MLITMAYHIHKQFHLLNLITICTCFYFCACGEKNLDQKNLTGLTKLEYHFGDASVPPEYHRSFTFLVSRDTLHVVADSYGEVLFDTTLSISGDVLARCSRIIRESTIEICNEEEAEPCTGGTSESLKLYAGGELFFNGHVYHCGGSRYGTMSGDTAMLVEFLKSQANDFNNWIK
jgi:hypothetical protein